ncbi:MAG: hypothetical protein GF390_01655, partial [Candidatus Pacebacteria bacterium]|nr:hypothetical protein [Candidatus Paceibacterota bacterium]
MYDVLSIGSAVVDVFIHSDKFQAQATHDQQTGQAGEQLCQLYGDKVEIEEFKVYTGGGATNTAVGWARLGFKTGVIAETGRDNFSQIVVNDLIREQVGIRLLIKEKKEYTGGSVILIGTAGKRIIMVHRGASSQLDPYDIPIYWLTKTKWVHVSSLAGQEQTLAKIFQIIRKNPQVNLSWNPGKADLSLLAQRSLAIKQIPCRVFFVNQQEWQLLEG